MKFSLLALSLVLLTQNLHAQPQDPPTPARGALAHIEEAVTRVPDELGRIFRYPLDEPAQFSRYALGLGALVLLDKPLTTFYQSQVETPLRGFRLPDAPKIFPESIGSGADGWLLLGISGTYLGGLFADDALAQKTGMAAAKATAYSYVVSQLFLKSVTGRNRPNPSLGTSSAAAPYTDNPLDWGHVHGPKPDAEAEATSFPSFHFTLYFAVAKVYQEAYDNYLIPYSLLTLGLVSNIQDHHHWVSDMAAGALIGTLIGSSVSKDYFGENSKVKLAPVLRPGETGLLLSYRF